MTVNSIDEITVVIVTYNSAHCISTLSRSLSNLKNIIFVDNASEDQTTASINSIFPKASFHFVPLEALLFPHRLIDLQEISNRLGIYPSCI